jgi:hypothetical protein
VLVCIWEIDKALHHQLEIKLKITITHGVSFSIKM